MVEVRAYIEGVEAIKIPELSEICSKDDWLGPLMEWCRDNRPDLKMDAIFSTDSEEPILSEVWFGGAPPLRAQQIGGILKSFSKPAKFT